VAASRPEEPAQVSPPRATIATVEVETAGTVLASGSAAAGSAVRLYVDDVFLAEVAADEAGSWAFVGELALAAGDHRLRADALIGSGGRVASRAEVTFEVVETLAQLEPAPPSPLPPAEPPAEPADAAAAPPPEASAPAPDTVTIRRGDDLWHIARRVYGAGIRYITIYDANRDQIRDPNLIYPGQVLVLPPP
jgi:nucleoid-associated protein YgaU